MFLCNGKLPPLLRGSLSVLWVMAVFFRQFPYGGFFFQVFSLCHRMGGMVIVTKFLTEFCVTDTRANPDEVPSKVSDFQVMSEGGRLMTILRA